MNTASQRILIVDQDEGMGSKLKLFLRSREHIAEACTNVEDARRFLDHFSCDIVMVDVDLPESGALELCYSLRNLSDPIRLVLLVSPKSESGALKLFAADEQLMKPFIGRQVLMLLENLARRPAPKPPASSSLRAPRPAAPVASASAHAPQAPSAVPVASRVLKQPPRAPQEHQAPQAPQAPRAPQAPQAAPPSPASRAAMLGIRGAGIVSSGAQPIRAARKVPEHAPPPQPVREEGEEGNISSLGPSHRNDASRPPVGAGDSRAPFHPGDSRAPFHPGDSRAPFNPDASRPPAQAVPAMRLPGRPPVASERPAAVDVQKAVEASAARPKPGRPQAMMTVMQSAGTLKDTPFPALLYKLFANQSTGTLTIQAGSTRTLYFLKGEPVHAISSSASDSLGAILVNLGYLPMESLNQVLDDLPVNKPLSQELLGRHLITHEALLEALDRQVYDRVINNFGLVAGTYMFVEGDDWLAEVRRFPQNPIALISDGVERFVGPNVLAEQLQAHLSKYVVKTEKFDFFREHFPSLERHESVLRLLNGQRTLQQISAEAGGDLMGTLRLIWSLKLADMIDFSAQPRADAQRSPEKPPLPRRLPTTSGANIPLMRPPAAAPSHKEDPQEKERKRLSGVVMGYYMRLGQQDHWQLLGVERDADVTQVRERFLGILDEMPPEKLHLLGDSMREKAEEVHEALKLAYNTITEPKSLKSYMVKVEMRRRTQERAQLQRAQPQPQPEAEPSRTVDLWEQADAERPASVPVFMPMGHQDDEVGQNRALRAFQVARKAVEEGRWKEAFHAAKTAAQFDPNNSEVTVLTAWIVYNLPHDDKSRQYKVCRQRIENELALNNAIPDAYLYLGRMEEDQRELRQALEHYRMALGLDPKHPAARKAIERLQRHPMLAKAEAAPAHEDANLLHRLKGFFGR